MLILGGLIDSQLRNFAGIASECIDPGGGSIDSQLRKDLQRLGEDLH